MLTQDRAFHLTAQLTLRRPHLLHGQSKPSEDVVNWLFLNTGERRFSFVYKIENPAEAHYNLPFRAELAFLMVEAVMNVVKLNQIYEVQRGEEIIGTATLINYLG